MSALNNAETEQMRAVKSIIEFVLREGYDPEKDDQKNQHIKRALMEAKTAVHTITQMKGYYPK